jgi:hypothetical protein
MTRIYPLSKDSHQCLQKIVMDVHARQTELPGPGEDP